MLGNIFGVYIAYFSQQGFGVLSVVLASQALSLLSSLLDDLRGGDEYDVGSTIAPAPLSIIGQPSSLSRVHRIFSSVQLNQLLFHLATISYRKVSHHKPGPA